LEGKAPDHVFDRGVTEEIFGMIDINGDGVVTLDEFVTKYLETQYRLQDKLNEVYQKIASHKRQRDEMEEQLIQEKKTEVLNPRTGIMNGSVLTVHVVEARDLEPMDMGGSSDPYVRLSIQGQLFNTTYKKSTLNPVWNESAYFDITDAQEPLLVEVFDKDTFGNDDFEGMCQVDLEELRDQVKKDLWFNLKQRNGADKQGRIRLMLHWVWSKVAYFEFYVNQWDQALIEDVEEKEQIEGYLKQLQSPFGFLEIVDDVWVDEKDDDEEQNEKTRQTQKAVGQIFQNEKTKAYEKKFVGAFEAVGDNFAKRFGFGSVPWFTCTKLVLYIYAVMTCFVLFFRADFINLTVCITGFYMIYNTDHVKKWTFQMLVLGIFLTMLIDIFFFVMNDYGIESKGDGGLESGVRRFSLNMSYASFFFRIIVALVFWKDSLDFTRIIKNQQDSAPNRYAPGSPGRDRGTLYKKQAEDIAAQYKARDPSQFGRL